MSGITTHVIDTVLGKPAAGMAVTLEKLDRESWLMLAESATDADGRCRELAVEATAGVYRLTFNVEDYMARAERKSIYPQVCVTFHCERAGHYHMPLLLSDNSYTTYRGS